MTPQHVETSIPEMHQTGKALRPITFTPSDQLVQQDKID